MADAGQAVEEPPHSRDNPSAALHDAESAQNAVDSLTSECREKWQHLEQLQQQLSNDYKGQSVAGHEMRAAIYAANELNLQAHIQLLKTQKLQPLPSDPVIQFELLCEGLKASVSKLQETLCLVMDQKKEMQAEISRAQRTQTQLEQVNQSLVEKLKKAQVPDTSQNPNERIHLRELEEKNTRVVNYSRQLMDHLAEFVNEHFPTPSRQQVHKWRSKRQQKASLSESTADNGFTSLQQILEELTNQCIDSPHDPYIPLETSFWPPYLELLFRCGIALKHPRDDSRIKLAPFNL